MDIRPVTLEGAHVRLEPLTLGHQQAVLEAAREWGLTLERVRDDIVAALRQQAARTALPFATLCKPSLQLVGGTRFLGVVPEHRRLEIGSTWIAAPWRRTAVNTEAKFLMLEHAFERLGCARVEFHADPDNETSRRAILRLGATEEGRLRGYKVTPQGEVRDAVFYSIIEAEWPAVKARLRQLLARDTHE